MFSFSVFLLCFCNSASRARTYVFEIENILLKQANFVNFHVLRIKIQIISNNAYII